MNRGRKTCAWMPEEEEKEEEEEESREQAARLLIKPNTSKINRLKRSPKSSQTLKSLCRSETDFKTPTRVPKEGFRTPVTDESPNNDSESQHEIIWDPTSPWTPVRTGRGRRRTGVFKSVDIADLANRIAPKSKKPGEAEASLLQWIGDTAVPCTPEIRQPRTKPKPSRQNPVEDLLKLAKQFDFNMFQQEEAHLQPRSSTAHEDQDLFPDEPPSSPRTPPDAARPQPQDRQDDLVVLQGTDDDLDMLFEGSTQKLGDLSQGFSTCPEGATPASGALSKQAADDFDDDWTDLLEDSLVMEMTQNPELFSEPRHSSTQKQTSARESQRLEGFPKRWIKATGNTRHAGPGLSQVLPPANGVSKTASQPTKPAEIQPWKVQPTAPSSSLSRSHPPRPFHSSTILAGPTLKEKTHGPLEDDVLTDLASEDLDSIFASDDIWDDDDALFSEACEKAEEVMTERPPNPSLSNPTPQGRQPTTANRAFLQPARNPAPPSGEQTDSRTSRYKFSRVKSASGTGSPARSASRQSAAPTAVQSYRGIQDDRFTKPHASKDATVTRCSDAEIEKKKQQAMERRRLRLLANQNAA